MQKAVEEKIFRLYRETFAAEPTVVLQLKGDGSDRSIFRIKGEAGAVIAVHGLNPDENDAFVTFSRHFAGFGLPVPHILVYDRPNGLYLESDLGDVTLYDRVSNTRSCSYEERRHLYFAAVRFLPEFQITAGRSLDYSVCFQTAVFDAEAMLRDLLYFRHAFLSRFYPNRIDQERLLKDFTLLIQRLIAEPADFFLYRDFQSRNIMVVDAQIYFIDYQSGRKGALQYDLASLLYDANVSLTDELREELIDRYLEIVNQYLSLPPARFMRRFFDFALIRVLQALAAFSYLAFEKNKPYFLSCIPSGIGLLGAVLQKSSAGCEMQELPKIVDCLCACQFQIDEENQSSIRLHRNDTSL